MTNQPPNITIHNAYLRYHQQLLFEHLSLTLPAGKITCLLGPSGVGKTSLLRLIAGLPSLDKSTEQVARIEAHDNLSIHNRISYLAQTDLLFPWLTALENIIVGYRLRNQLTTEIFQRAEQLLVQLGLAKALRQYPAQLSGGMRQRVALARTLLEDRPIVLMDEPFSALDTITRTQLQTLTASQLKNRTVLLITHDPLEALRMGDQIMVMSGSPAKLSAPIKLQSESPRAVTDDEVLHWQGELLQQLTTAKELTA